MKSYEFSIDYNIAKKINFYGVGFYNIIENVIDVGVIWEDNIYYTVPPIGTDVPGDWNGYWYFKNTAGSITQGGFEASITFKQGPIFASLSHSYVKLIDAADQQLGSMYITADKNFKAYPENVTRFNIIASIFRDLKAGLNYTYYYKWYSPKDQEVGGNHMVNLSLKYTLLDKLLISASVVNLLGQKTLYPMNSNASGQDLSDGTPAMENTSIWFKLGYKF